MNIINSKEKSCDNSCEHFILLNSVWLPIYIIRHSDIDLKWLCYHKDSVKGVGSGQWFHRVVLFFIINSYNCLDNLGHRLQES